MELPRPVIWALTIVYALCFVSFCVVALLAWTSPGYTYEHELFGVGLPVIFTALLAGTAASAALSWAHFKRDPYTGG
jgi:hypothetical protein